LSISLILLIFNVKIFSHIRQSDFIINEFDAFVFIFLALFLDFAASEDRGLAVLGRDITGQDNFDLGKPCSCLKKSVPLGRKWKRWPSDRVK